MDLRESFKKGIIRRIENGNTINFWKDNWIFHTPIIDVMTSDTNYDLDEKVCKYN